MEAANQAAASPKTEQVAGKEQSVDVEQSGASAVFRSLSLGGGSGGNKPKPTVTAGNILQLQRMVGNQSVQRLIQRQMAQKNSTKSPAPVKPQPVIVARDDDNNYIDKNPDAQNENLEEQEEGGEGLYGDGSDMVVQVTDLDVLDNIDDNAPLPEASNEVENQPPPQTANRPAPRMAMGTHRNNASPPQQQQPQVQQPVAPPQNAPGGFKQVSKPDSPQNGLISNHRTDFVPKTYTDAADLHHNEVGEEQGQGSGNERRKKDLVKTKLPVKTRYLNKIERRAYRVTIQGGVFKDAQDQALDSSNAGGFTRGSLNGLIFVMSQRGKLYAADMVAEYDAGGYDAANHIVKQGTREVLTFHHSSFKSGKAVAGAGELVVKSGTLEEVSDGSGHYQPKDVQMVQVLTEFQKFGVLLSNVRFKRTLSGSRFPNGVNAADYLASGGDMTAAHTVEQNRLNPQSQQQQQPQGQAQQPQQNGNGGEPFYQS